MPTSAEIFQVVERKKHKAEPRRGSTLIEVLLAPEFVETLKENGTEIAGGRWSSIAQGVLEAFFRVVDAIGEKLSSVKIRISKITHEAFDQRSPIKGARGPLGEAIDNLFCYINRECLQQRQIDVTWA